MDFGGEANDGDDISAALVEGLVVVVMVLVVTVEVLAVDTVSVMDATGTEVATADAILDRRFKL